MLNEFIKENVEICINKNGKRAVAINGSDPAKGRTLLNIDMDNIKDVFILPISDDEYHICKLEKEGYNILYKIKIDLEKEVEGPKSNINEYLSDIIYDSKAGIYSYVRGYFEGLIDTLIKYKGEM